MENKTRSTLAMSIDQITRSLKRDEREAFESNSKDILLLEDLPNILSGNIHPLTTVNAMRHGLKALQDYPASGDFSSPYWNPVTAALLNCVEQLVRSSALSNRTTTRAKHSPSTATSSSKRTPDRETAVRPPVVKPPSTKSTRCLVSTAPLPSPEKIVSIREQLRLRYEAAALHPFSNHAHVLRDCVNASCAICRDLYMKLSISKCEGHTPCHSTGYFPHLGSRLWKRIRDTHIAGKLITLTEEQQQRDGTIPCLRSAYKKPGSRSSPHKRRAPPAAVGEDDLPRDVQRLRIDPEPSPSWTGPTTPTYDPGVDTIDVSAEEPPPSPSPPVVLQPRKIPPLPEGVDPLPGFDTD